MRPGFFLLTNGLPPVTERHHHCVCGPMALKPVQLITNLDGIKSLLKNATMFAEPAHNTQTQKLKDRTQRTVTEPKG